MYHFLKHNKLLLSILFIFITLFSFNLFFPPQAQATCYCINPGPPNNCNCTTSASNATSNPQYPATFDGVSLLCDLPGEANSMFSIKNPVCETGYSNEIVPYCAPVIADCVTNNGVRSCTPRSGTPYEYVCYGTAFAIIPGNIPIGDTFNPNWNGAISFNGFHLPAGSGQSQLGTCWNNNFCCSRSDVVCDDTNVPNNTGVPVIQCGPKVQPPFLDRAAACALGPGTPPGTSNAGESRLWFSQSRLVSTLSSMAQALFNPKGVNQYYEATGSAFSNNSSKSNRSSELTNETALTTKIEEHQGIDDGIAVVNTTDNNSSLMKGVRAPTVLSPYYDEYKDRACYIPTAKSNPGDDLIGPKIEAEIALTQQFTYDAQPTQGCIGDGLPYSRARNSTTSVCCSDIHISDPNPCIPFQTNPNILCTDRPGYTNTCQVGYPNGTIYCCPNPGNQCAVETGVCGTLDDVILTARGELNVFSKTPLIEHIYETIVTGAGSLYKRFMPYLGADPQFEEIPAVASFQAQGRLYSANAPVRLDIAEGQASTPQIYFPHIGSLDKYWLEDFQTGIRPQGYGRTTSAQQSSLPPSLGSCNEAPEPFCSANNLLSVCGNDPTKASNASQVCLQESGGNPGLINNDCQTGTGTYDFSIGLFQINLIAHCPDAFGPNTTSPYCEIIDDGTDCSMYNSFARHPITNCNSTLRTCIEQFINPSNNINMMAHPYLSNSCSIFSKDWVLASQACNLP